MRNIKLTISYCGTNYSGWQIQPNVTTIQETIELALKNWLNEDIKITGSGRTDAGVHAENQIANFLTKNSKIPIEGFIYGLNSKLPSDIVIKNSEIVNNKFHSRKSATKKRYRYQIYFDKTPSPFLLDRSLFFKNNILDLDKMIKGAKYLEGKHDFKAFTASKNCSKTTIRTIFNTKFIKNKNNLNFYIEGDGFLMKMVRNIVGTLLDIGNRRYPPEKILDILKSKDRKNCGATAPPYGLYLEKVYYDNN